MGEKCIHETAESLAGLEWGSEAALEILADRPISEWVPFWPVVVPNRETGALVYTGEIVIQPSRRIYANLADEAVIPLAALSADEREDVHKHHGYY